MGLVSFLPRATGSAHALPPLTFISLLQFSRIFGVRFSAILAKIYGACTHVDVKEPVVSLATYAIAAAPAALAIPVTSGAVDTPVAVPVWLELIAIVVASISGALTAREKKLDLVGAVCLAVLCSLGGGLLRDMTLQVGNVYILNQPIAMPAAILTAAVVFVAPSVIAKQDRLIAVLDIFAVGLYAATGADKALVYGFDPIICITMGFFTGVGGGMLRDVFLGQVPYIFQRSNLYAVAAIAGAGVYVLFAAAGISHVVGVVACVGVTMGLRWLSLRYNILSPTELDLTRMVPRRHGRRLAADAAEDTARAEAPAAKPRIDRPDRSAAELARRRRRTLADIESRRELERRATALDRLKRNRRRREQRKLDL